MPTPTRWRCWALVAAIGLAAGLNARGQEGTSGDGPAGAGRLVDENLTDRWKREAAEYRIVLQTEPESIPSLRPEPVLHWTVNFPGIWRSFFDDKWHGPRTYDRQRTHKPIPHNITPTIGRSTRPLPAPRNISAACMRARAAFALRRSVHPRRMRPPENNSARPACFSAAPAIYLVSGGHDGSRRRPAGRCPREGSVPS